VAWPSFIPTRFLRAAHKLLGLAQPRPQSPDHHRTVQDPASCLRAPRSFWSSVAPSRLMGILLISDDLARLNLGEVLFWSRKSILLQSLEVLGDRSSRNERVNYSYSATSRRSVPRRCRAPASPCYASGTWYPLRLSVIPLVSVKSVSILGLRYFLSPEHDAVHSPLEKIREKWMTIIRRFMEPSSRCTTGKLQKATY